MPSHYTRPFTLPQSLDPLPEFPELSVTGTLSCLLGAASCTRYSCPVSSSSCILTMFSACISTSLSPTLLFLVACCPCIIRLASGSISEFPSFLFLPDFVPGSFLACLTFARSPCLNRASFRKHSPTALGRLLAGKSLVKLCLYHIQRLQYMGCMGGKNRAMLFNRQCS